jgi:hypothetical protein
LAATWTKTRPPPPQQLRHHHRHLVEATQKQQQAAADLRIAQINKEILDEENRLIEARIARDEAAGQKGEALLERKIALIRKEMEENSGNELFQTQSETKIFELYSEYAKEKIDLIRKKKGESLEAIDTELKAELKAQELKAASLELTKEQLDATLVYIAKLKEAIGSVEEEIRTKARKPWEDFIKRMRETFIDGLADVIQGTKKFSDVMKDIFHQLMTYLIKQMLEFVIFGKGGLGQIFGGGSSGGGGTSNVGGGKKGAFGLGSGFGQALGVAATAFGLYSAGLGSNQVNYSGITPHIGQTIESVGSVSSAPTTRTQSGPAAAINVTVGPGAVQVNTTDLSPAKIEEVGTAITRVVARNLSEIDAYGSVL